MPDMAEKLGVGTGVRELKIGQSFLNQRKLNVHQSKSGSSRNGTLSSRNGDQNNTENSYHTIRYDFKPASSSTSSTGFLEVAEDNKVAVKIPHEGSGQTNFSGHQKEANAKDCLLIIDHETGEITLEKLSSQIMVKKTRAEKSETKTSQDKPLNLPPSNSRPNTPNNFDKSDSGKSGQSRKGEAENKTISPIAEPKISGSSKITANNKEFLQPKKNLKGANNLSLSLSTDSSKDGDSDSDTSSKVEKGPITAPTSSSSTVGTPRYKSGQTSGSTTGFEVSSSKHSNQSSPSNLKLASPKRKAATEAKQSKPIQSSLKSSQTSAKMPELNDGFDDSDESDNEYSNSEKANEDFSLDNFTSNNTSQTARSIPNITQYTTNYGNAPVNKKPEHKTKSKVDMPSSSSSMTATSTVPSMPQFLNDDLELSESDSDS